MDESLPAALAPSPVSEMVPEAPFWYSSRPSLSSFASASQTLAMLTPLALAMSATRTRPVSRERSWTTLR